MSLLDVVELPALQVPVLASYLCINGRFNAYYDLIFSRLCPLGQIRINTQQVTQETEQ